MLLYQCCLSYLRGFSKQKIFVVSGLLGSIILVFVVFSCLSEPLATTHTETHPPPSPKVEVTQTSNVKFYGCKRDAVVGGDFDSINHYDISEVRRASTPQLYKVSTFYEGEYFLKLQCKDTFGPFHLGSQGVFEYLAFLIADFLRLPVPIACHVPLILDAAQFPSLPSSCVYNYNGNSVVMGTATPSLDLSTGYRRSRYPGYFRRSLQASRRKVLIPEEHKQMVSDLVSIAIMDFIMVNNDRDGNAMTNVFYSNELERFILMDNGFMGGSPKLERSISICDWEYSRDSLHRPSLILTHMENLTPKYEEKVPRTVFCVHSKKLFNHLKKNSEEVTAFLMQHFVESPVVQVMIDNFDLAGDLSAEDLLLRNVEGCEFEDGLSGRQVFVQLVDIFHRRVNNLLVKLKGCKGKYGAEFVWQL
ncbi:hypothetical protein P9112_001526 [Eukaryota sp. TZLM1-RC]